jgi:SecD/SecF fusion protein
MNKTLLFLLIGVAIVVAAFIALSVAAFLALPLLMERMTPLPRGAVLIYEVDPDSVPKGQTVDMEVLTRMVDRRVNRRKTLARTQQLNDQRIEVALLRRSRSDQKRVERLLTQVGTLEFRILANNRHNKDLIDRALSNSAKAQIFDGGGNLLAWWVPVKAGEEKSLATYPEIARRTTKRDKRESMEVLVLKDVYDVTGAYLTRVEAGIDPKGQPCVYVTFNHTGGQLFGMFTGDHLPDTLTGFTYNLGIILNGELYSAPCLRGVLFQRIWHKTGARLSNGFLSG